jgi:hypothetical protein
MIMTMMRRIIIFAVCPNFSSITRAILSTFPDLERGLVEKYGGLDQVMRLHAEFYGTRRSRPRRSSRKRNSWPLESFPRWRRNSSSLLAALCWGTSWWCTRPSHHPRRWKNCPAGQATQVPLLSRDPFPRGLSRTPEESGKRPGGHDHGDANLPRASINIEGKEFVALIDTGATHNIIRREAVTGQMKPLDQPAQLQTASRHRSLPSSHRRHPGT